MDYSTGQGNNYMANNKGHYILYRYAKPNKSFKPRPHWRVDNIKCIYAGLDKSTWNMLALGNNNIRLHKIALTKRQASKCLVAETCYKWDEDWEGLSYRDYNNSLIPLTEYKGNYNKPEVLIPFEVTATIMESNI